MSNNPEIQIVHVEAHDTGIGQEAGYANDQAFIDATNAERDALPAAARNILDALDAAETRSFIHGDKS